MSRRLFAALPLAFAACAIPPKDPFRRAEYELQQDDLLQALRAYDAVPLSHPRYPDARAAAVEVELRMRRCHELILEALMLRGEWRDAEALERLQRAREHWPLQPSLEQWIVATEQRLETFGERTAQVAQSGEPTPAAAPIVEMMVPAASPNSSAPTQRPAPASAGGEDASTGRVDSGAAAKSAQPAEPASVPQLENAFRQPSSPVVEPEPAGSGGAAGRQATELPEPAGEIARPLPTGEDPVALGLVSVEARLARSEREGAVHDLIELSRRFPDDRRVQRRLGPLLHQRALMNYGQGLVSAAVADWQRVLALDPDNESVRKLLDKAKAEVRDPDPN